MIRFRTLGAVNVTDPDGHELRPVLTQSKRLALLAYLATSTELRRRDTVVGLFWPELDEEHARGALRQALRFLRRALGDGVIETRGEEEVGVNRTMLWSDSVAFEKACAEGRNAEAMQLYGGPFLDGLFVSDAGTAFQEWLDEQRARFRVSAAAAAWSLAEERRSAGERAEAARLARLATALAPDDETELTRLVTFLDRLGDRSAALNAYEAFANRLRKEHGAEPGPETRALLQTVRARSREEHPPSAPEAPEEQDAAASAPPERDAPAQDRSRARRPRTLVVAVAIGAVVVMGSIVVIAGGRLARDADQPTLVVLPLEDLTGDTAHGYIADGLTEQLITDLAQTSSLRVSSRRTMLGYRDSGLSAAVIVRRLHADAVVSGTVQRLGDTVHMTAQLALTGANHDLWDQSVEGSREDLLRMQRELARALIGRLHAALRGTRPVDLAAVRSMHPGALDLYQRGRYWWNKRGKAGLLRSIELFTQALDIDPGFALAYSGMADAYVQLGYAGFLAPADAFPKAAEAARRALMLDAELAEPHAALGYEAMYFEWDWGRAEREFRRALALNPSYATGHEWYGLFLAAMGRFDEALAHERLAQELDPLSSAVTGTAGWVLHYAGRNADAERELKIALRLDSTFAIGHLYLGRVYQALGNLDSALAEYAAVGPLRDWAPTVAGVGNIYGLQGRRSDALAALARLHEMSRQQYVTAYAMALIHTGLGERDSAFAWLDRAVVERTHWLVWLNRDARWAPLRSERRFQDLVRRVGLPR